MRTRLVSLYVVVDPLDTGRDPAAARAILPLARDAGALFLVNDRPDITRAVDADGVHLGQDDLPVAAAREIVGPVRMIGVSTHDLEQARAAEAAGADYVAFGPIYPTSTKPDALPARASWPRFARRERPRSSASTGTRAASAGAPHARSEGERGSPRRGSRHRRARRFLSTPLQTLAYTSAGLRSHRLAAHLVPPPGRSRQPIGEDTLELR
jgi:hypothetical protein